MQEHGHGLMEVITETKKINFMAFMTTQEADLEHQVGKIQMALCGFMEDKSMEEIHLWTSYGLLMSKTRTGIFITLKTKLLANSSHLHALVVLLVAMEIGLLFLDFPVHLFFIWKMNTGLPCATFRCLHLQEVILHTGVTLLKEYCGYLVGKPQKRNLVISGGFHFKKCNGLK